LENVNHHDEVRREWARYILTESSRQLGVEQPVFGVAWGSPGGVINATNPKAGAEDGGSMGAPVAEAFKNCATVDSVIQVALDHDMIVGTVHFWEYLELFLWLQFIGYEGWYSLDLFPYRIDPVQACNQSIRNVEGMNRLVEQLGVNKLIEMIKEGMLAEIQETLTKKLFQVNSKDYCREW